MHEERRGCPQYFAQTYIVHSLFYSFFVRLNLAPDLKCDSPLHLKKMVLPAIDRSSDVESVADFFPSGIIAALSSSSLWQL